MRLVNCQYAIGKVLCQCAGAFTFLNWEFQKEVVSLDTNADKVLKNLSFSPLVSFSPPRSQEKMVDANRRVFYLSDR